MAYPASASYFIKYLNFEIVCKDSYASFSFSTVMFYLKTFFYLYFVNIWFRHKFNAFFVSNVFFEKYGNFRERIRRYALLRSPFVNKKAREHFEFRIVRYPLFFSFNFINLILPHHTRWFFIFNWFQLFSNGLRVGYNYKQPASLFKAFFLNRFLTSKSNKLLFFIRYLFKLRPIQRYSFSSNNALLFEQLFFFEYFTFFMKFVSNFSNFYSFKCYLNARLQIYTNNLR